jgi:RNA polymerase sigma-70 factor (ECF subfamily)
MRDEPPAEGRPPLGRDDCGRGDMDSTVDLLRRIRAGDTRARDLLYRRYFPVVKRLARGKVPDRARPLYDTDELVHRTMNAAFAHVGTFEHRHEGAFLAFLRKVLHNKIRDIARLTNPELVEMDGGIPHGGPSPLEATIGTQRLEAYYRALEGLNEQQRQAVTLRLEAGYTYEEIASAIECPSANAARMLIGRALARMAVMMSAHMEDFE